MATIEEIRKDLEWPDDGRAFADAPRWVTTRMKCYVPKVFADLLALITRDVVEFNDPSAFLRHDRKFDTELGIQEIAVRHKVHPNQVSTWKQRAVEGMKEVFTKGAERNRGDHEGEIRDLHAKIGELTVERDFLAKGLKW